MALQLYMARFYVTAGQSITITPSGGLTYTLNVVQGWYYHAGYTSETTPQFAEYLQTSIRALGAPLAATTVTFDTTTGKYTLAFNTGGNVTLSFGSASQLKEIMMMTAVAIIDPAPSFTSEEQCQYLWRPSETMTTCSGGDMTRWWAEHSRTIVHQAPTGACSCTDRSSTYDGEFIYECLPTADVIITDDTVAWEPFEQFFEDAIAHGYHIRCYPDATKYAAANVFEGRFVGGGEDGIGSFAEFSKRFIEEWDGLWNVTLKLIKHVDVS